MQHPFIRGAGETRQLVDLIDRYRKWETAHGKSPSDIQTRQADATLKQSREEAEAWNFETVRGQDTVGKKQASSPWLSIQHQTLGFRAF